MTTIVKAAGAAEFLGLVPHTLGFTPHESVVVIPFSGARTLGSIRFDIPPESDVDATSATMIGMVCRLDSADALAAVIYTESRCAGAGLPRRELAQGILKRADASGLRVVDALCVAADGWGSYLDEQCPRDGRTLAALGQVPGVSELPEVHGDQWSGAELPAVDQVRAKLTARALSEVQRVFQMLHPDSWLESCDHDTDCDTEAEPAMRDTLRAIQDPPALFEEALDWAEITPERAAALIWCFDKPALRDVALVQWASNRAFGDQALQEQLLWTAGQPYPDELGARFAGRGPRPVLRRLTSGLALTREAAALAPRNSQPGLLSACAWLSWALGRSTHAERYGATAHAIDPHHGLAAIVRTYAAAGHLPDWVWNT